MAVNFGEELDELEKQGGSGLRRKLEEVLAQNAELTEKVAGYEAEKVIGAKGLDLVKPEDLAGVKADELEAKAEALQEQRLAERREVVKEILAQKQGLEGDELESAVEEWMAPSAGESTDSSGFGEVNEISGLGGRRPPKLNPEQMTALEKIEAGLS